VLGLLRSNGNGFFKDLVLILLEVNELVLDLLGYFLVFPLVVRYVVEELDIPMTN